MNTFEDALGQLPKPILDKLESMIGRVRRLLFIRGLFATIAVALVSLLAIMAIDAAVTLFSTTARWLLSLAGLFTTLAAAWWFLVRPLSRRFTLTKMARILEVRHPELQERISTAVELLASKDPDSIRGSQELIAAVVDSAVTDVASVDPRAEFKQGRSKKFILAAGVSGAIILLLLAIWPTRSWTLLARAMAPFLDIGNAYADTLVVDPGSVRVAKGEPVTIQVSVKHKRLKRAEVRRQLPDGSESVERMALIAEEPDGTKRFSLTFPSVAEDFDYRVRAGAALSEYFDVTTVEPPSVAGLTVGYEFPEYTRMPDAESKTETGEIRAVAHTRVSVTAELNRPVWTAKMILNENTGVADPVVEGNKVTWSLDLKPGMNGNWRLELADEEGFNNQPVSYPLEVLPDKAPTVRIMQPVQRDISLKPTERLPIDLEVTEDFGIGDVILLVTPDGAIAPTEVAQPVPDAPVRPGTYAARAVLDIPSLRLAPEQVRLAVQVRVRDNRPTDYDGPGTGMSEVIFVTLDQNAKSIADQAIEAQRKEIEEQIREAKKELERARDDMRRAEQDLSRTEAIDEKATERLQEFTAHNEAAREKLEEVATTLNNPLFQEQSARAEKIANETLAEAQDKADMIPGTDAKSERVAGAKASREKVEEAMRDLDTLSRSMREAQKDYEAISKLNELANRQQELAMKAEDWAGKAKEEAEQMARNAATEEVRKQFEEQQRREAEQFRNEQNRVEQQLGEMLKENAAALSEVLEQQRQETDALAEQARALAKQQESLKEASKEATEKNAGQEEALRQALLEQLEAMQAKVAEETTEALQSGAEASKPGTPEATPEEDTPAPSESLAEAAEEAARAAEELSKEKLDEAKKSASEASESLAKAATEENAKSAERDKATPPSPAEGNAETGKEKARDLPLPAAILSDLALRQETIAKQLEAVSEGRLQEALGLMESQLNAEAKALEAEAKGLEQSLQNLQQNQARANADQAERALGEGAREAEDSANQLARAQEQQEAAEAKGEVDEGELSPQAKSAMQQGQNDQQQSERALAQAALAFAQSSKAIGQTMEGLDPSEKDERLTKSEDLAEGFEDVAKSTQSKSADEAASQSQQAADSLQQLAQSAMQKMGGSPQGKPGEPKGPTPPQSDQELAGDPESADLNETGKKTGDADGSGIPPELRNLGISAADWARFKGALVGGNATAIETELPAEYRELVGRYFQVIAKEAGKGK